MNIYDPLVHCQSRKVQVSEYDHGFALTDSLHQQWLQSSASHGNSMPHRFMCLHCLQGHVEAAISHAQETVLMMACGQNGHCGLCVLVQPRTHREGALVLTRRSLATSQAQHIGVFSRLLPKGRSLRCRKPSAGTAERRGPFVIGHEASNSRPDRPQALKTSLCGHDVSCLSPLAGH